MESDSRIMKKGFTIVEVLGVVILLSIIALLGISVYSNIQEKAKEKTLANKIEFIELAAEKYAEENNLSADITISVQYLIDQGYLKSDDGKTDEVINPVNQEQLNCYTIDITVYGEVSSKFNWDRGSKCDFVSEENQNSKIIIKAYKYENKKVVGEIKQTNNVLDWTNTDILLVINSKEENYSSINLVPDGGLVESKTNNNKLATTFANNATVNPDSYDNVFVISASLFIDMNYNISIYQEEQIYSTKIQVKIDKEVPTINSKVNGDWVNVSTKKAELSIYDGNGSGPAGIYISKDVNDIKKSTFNQYQEGINDNKITLDLEQGFYYIWAKDNVGNISKTSSKLVVDNIDTIPPIIDEDSLSIKLNANYTYDIDVNTVDNESGVYGYYIGEISCDKAPYSITFKDEYVIDRNYGDYNFCVKDRVGNISSMDIDAHITYEVNFNKVRLDEVQITSEFKGNIIFVLDESGSMSSSNRMNNLKTVTKGLVEGLTFNGDVTVSIVSFTHVSSIKLNQSKDKTEIINKLNSLVASGGTSFSLGVATTNSLLASITNGQPNFVIFLSDGYGGTVTTSAVNTLNEKAKVYSVGVGSYVSSYELKKIAQNNYFSAKDGLSSLQLIFRDISESITEEYENYIKENIVDGSLKLETIKLSSEYPISVSLNGKVIASYTSSNSIININGNDITFNLYEFMRANSLNVAHVNNIVVKYYYEGGSS